MGGGEDWGVVELEAHLRHARAGDPDAVDRLLARLRPHVESYVERRMAPRARRWADVDDVVQGILLEVARGLAFLPDDAGSAELLRRMRRTAKSRVQDAGRNHAKLVGESAMPAKNGVIPEPVRTNGCVTAADSRRWMAELVARLPEQYREVVRLCALEELTYVEVGGRLGLQPDTVRKRYETARAALARRLGSRDDA